MERRVYLFFCFLLFFLSFSYNSYSESDVIFYKSDEIGIAIEEIPWYKADECEYVLKVVTSSNGDAQIKDKILLRNGKELKRWKIFYSEQGSIEKELYYERKKLKTEKIFGFAGRIVSKKEFGKSGLLKITRYKYVGNLLNQRDVVGKDGEELWREVFSYDRWGRLIRVVRIFPKGNRIVSLYNIGDSGLYDELQDFGTNTVVFHYDEKGREVEREIWKDDVLLSSRYIDYYTDSSKRKLVRTIYPKEKRKIVENYNSDGLLIVKKAFVSGKLESEEDYTWKQDLLIKKKIRKKGRGVEIYIYFYDASKKLVKEEHWVRGELESIKEYTGQKRMVESFYRNGEVFLKRYYLDNRETREEIIENGKVVRERKFD